MSEEGLWFLELLMSRIKAYIVQYGVITNDVSDYINLLVRIAPIICKHSLLWNQNALC